jgi:hypothetical protein
MPAFKNHNATSCIPNTPTPQTIQSLQEIPAIFPERNYTIAGITKDSAGAVLGNCTIFLFDMSNSNIPVLAQSQISDSDGNYSFPVDKSLRFWAVSYKAGSPDVSGVTVNTLAGI